MNVVLTALIFNRVTLKAKAVIVSAEPISFNLSVVVGGGSPNCWCDRSYNKLVTAVVKASDKAACLTYLKGNLTRSYLECTLNILNKCTPCNITRLDFS